MMFWITSDCGCVPFIVAREPFKSALYIDIHITLKVSYETYNVQNFSSLHLYNNSRLFLYSNLPIKSRKQDLIHKYHIEWNSHLKNNELVLIFFYWKSVYNWFHNENRISSQWFTCCSSGLQTLSYLWGTPTLKDPSDQRILVSNWWILTSKNEQFMLLFSSGATAACDRGHWNRMQPLADVFKATHSTRRTSWYGQYEMRSTQNRIWKTPSITRMICPFAQSFCFSIKHHRASTVR